MERLRQTLLNMHHTGGLSDIDPDLYEDARAYIEKLKEDYYSIENPLESRAGSLIIEEIGSISDTVQEIFSLRTRQVLDLAFQQVEGQYFDRDEARKMLPVERAMYTQIVEAIAGCREVLVQGEEYLLGDVDTGISAFDELGVDDDTEDRIEPDQVSFPYALVRICSDIESFMGVDGEIYALERGDLVTLPENNADVLCERDIALNIKLNK